MTIAAVAVTYPVLGNAEEDAKPAVNLVEMRVTIDKLAEKSQVSLIDVPLVDAIGYLENYHKVQFDTGNQKLPTAPIRCRQTSPFAEILYECLGQRDWSYAVKPNGDILIYPIRKPKKP